MRDVNHTGSMPKTKGRKTFVGSRILRDDGGEYEVEGLPDKEHRDDTKLSAAERRRIRLLVPKEVRDAGAFVVSGEDIAEGEAFVDPDVYDSTDDALLSSEQKAMDRIALKALRAMRRRKDIQLQMDLANLAKRGQRAFERKAMKTVVMPWVHDQITDRTFETRLRFLRIEMVKQQDSDARQRYAGQARRLNRPRNDDDDDETYTVPVVPTQGRHVIDDDEMETSDDDFIDDSGEEDTLEREEANVGLRMFKHRMGSSRMHKEHAFRNMAEEERRHLKTIAEADKRLYEQERCMEGALLEIEALLRSFMTVSSRASSEEEMVPLNLPAFSVVKSDYKKCLGKKNRILEFRAAKERELRQQEEDRLRKEALVREHLREARLAEWRAKQKAWEERQSAGLPPDNRFLNDILERMRQDNQ